MYGYAGKLVRVDLTRKRITLEDLGEEVARKYLGGAGVAAKIIFDEVGPKVDPLSPENRLVFATGPYQGTVIPGAGRYNVSARSPLTRVWGEANVSGFWGPELKFSGFDGIVFQGKADSPVYLWVHEGEAELKDAKHLWGKDTIVTEETVKKELGETRARVASIGLAGERMVRFASVISDRGLAAGRTGMGAVMGSKNLKAVAVRGIKEVEVAKPEEFRELTKVATELVRTRAARMTAHGTAGDMDAGHVNTGNVPVKYWTMGSWLEGIGKICGVTMSKTILVRPVSCFSCPAACHRYVKVEEPKKYATEGLGPEYETIGMLGSLCLNDSLPAITKANDLCNRYGMDTISAGGVIAFAMMCREKGWLTKKDLDGVDLKWGNADAVITMIERIGERKGIGRDMGEGIKPFSEKIGKEAAELAVHVKGLDYPAHDPRAWFAMALNYATSNRGACHQRGFSTGTWPNPEQELYFVSNRWVLEGKGRVVKAAQDATAIKNSLIHCNFAGLSLTNHSRLLSTLTGWEVTLAELLETGERIWNLQRMFNVRMGVTRKDDTMPKLMSTPLPDGPTLGRAPDLEPMLEEYYRERGWDEDGKPTKEKLLKLGLA